MRHVVLLFNPKSGQHGAARVETITRIVDVLKGRGLEVQAVATEGPGTAGSQAVAFCSTAVDTILACGGDGTVHEVLQGLAFQKQIALGVVPLGSANALARHLGLSTDPLRAALQQIDYLPASVPVGRVAFRTAAGEGSRYFLVMAGAGPDGALVYKMLASAKHRFGRAMYYVRALHLFCSTRFSKFYVRVEKPSELEQQVQAVSAMAVRVGDLGGLFSPLVRGASVDQTKLLLTIAKTPASLSLLAWFAMSWARLHRWNRYVDVREIEEFSCGPGDKGSVHVQADGEWLGYTPMSVTLLPDGINLLMPQK